MTELRDDRAQHGEKHGPRHQGAPIGAQFGPQRKAPTTKDEGGIKPAHMPAVGGGAGGDEPARGMHTVPEVVMPAGSPGSSSIMISTKSPGLGSCATNATEICSLISTRISRCSSSSPPTCSPCPLPRQLVPCFHCQKCTPARHTLSRVTAKRNGRGQPRE